MAGDKERIDILLVEQGMYTSREKAKAAIMAGLVFVDQERVEKPGTKYARTVQMHVKGALHPYVSRGGLKLEKALQYFDINLEDKVMIDIGASTGGFSDCALQHGVSFIYAIDVGYNQLAWSIRSSPKVKVMERTNFRYVKPEQFMERQPNFATIDVSFISLKHILPTLRDLLGDGGTVVALIKPQFEAGKEQVGKSGVIKDVKIHEEVLHKVIELAGQLNFHLEGLTYSPITGGQGNIEFLAYWSFQTAKVEGQQTVLDFDTLVSEVVQAANNTLG